MKSEEDPSCAAEPTPAGRAPSKAGAARRALERAVQPLRTTDDAARSQARALLAQARVAALASHEAGTNWPLVSRVSLALGGDGQPIILISRLSAHFAALEAHVRCSLLVSEAEIGGDPLRVARMTVFCNASRLDRMGQAPERERAREAFLRHQPEAELYADFGDFDFWRLRIERASLNAGFGRAGGGTRVRHFVVRLGMRRLSG